MIRSKNLTMEEIDRIIDNGKMIFCFDYDDTLVSYEIGLNKSVGNPKRCRRCLELLRERYDKGHYIIIYTGKVKEQREGVLKALRERNIPCHLLIMGKPKAHIYIDDCTVNTDDYIKNPKYYDKKYEKVGNDINQAIREGKNI